MAESTLLAPPESTAPQGTNASSTSDASSSSSVVQKDNSNNDVDHALLSCDTTSESPPSSTSSSGGDDSLSDDANHNHMHNNNNSSNTHATDNYHDDPQVLTSLARQLEFYFSKSNLARDTYLQTLRSLNDGFVPATILATFAKVQLLTHSNPDLAAHAICQAADHYSSVLQVVSVSTLSNKRVEDTDENTILAVGPCDDDIFLLPSTTTTLPTTTATDKPAIQNTIILRDVSAAVTPEEVHELFSFQGCPPIQDLHQDVANCWFVTLDTDSREDMIQVMLELRSKTLQGETIKARLKAVSTVPAMSTYTPLVAQTPAFYPTQVYAGDRNLSYTAPRKPQSVEGKKKTTYSSGSSSSGGGEPAKKSFLSNNNKPHRGGRKKMSEVVTVIPPSPPPLVESQFPALVVEWTPTTTTTTSTESTVVVSDSLQETPKVGGYAAALLKPPTATMTTTTVESNSSGTTLNRTTRTMTKKPNDKKHKSKKTVTPVKATATTTNVTSNNDNNNNNTTNVGSSVGQLAPVALKWGGGRSFADVLKKEESS